MAATRRARPSGVAREIEVHGGVTNWYIEVNNPPHSFRAELGYKSANGRFFSLCRSNTVHTPAPDSSDVIDENWTDVAANYERVYALSGGYADDNNQSGELQELFEERLRRPMGNAQPAASLAAEPSECSIAIATSIFTSMPR